MQLRLSLFKSGLTPKLTAAVMVLLAPLALANTPAASLDTQAIIQGDESSWLSHGNDYAETRYSELESINRDSVKQLGLAWSFDTRHNRGLEATPIIVDGVMFVTGNWSEVHALDARTGEELWHFDPEVPKEWAKMACCDVVNRGVAVYEGKVIFGTLDARLIALDAASGKQLWSTQTADLSKYPYTITGAPRVAKGKVYIGNGGAEYGVRGYVSAYDVNTGEQVWRFYTVPGDPADGFENAQMEQAAKTWSGEWWKIGGGGTVWDSIVYDPELDQLYIGVGNGGPWAARHRTPEPGDNLFISSIVALNPDTGEYIWHYQETPGETWDYTAAQHIMLADMEWQGEPRKVIWHAPKNGFFFIIDRSNGKLLSAEPYANVNWATHYDLETGRPVETEKARYADGVEMIRPSSMGAHNWQPMAHHPGTGYVYIPVLNSLVMFEDVEEYIHRWGQWNLGVVSEIQSPPDPLLAEQMVRAVTSGELLAWDPKTQSPAWKVKHPLTWNGGLLATGGDLVFQGTSHRTFDAYDASNGELLWTFDAKAGVMGSPVTYSIDGEQYVTVVSGWGGAFGLIAGLEQDGGIPPSRVLTFKLGSKGELPENPEKVLHEPPARLTEDEATLARGRTLYHTFCHSCHGQDVISNGAVPDLRHLPRVFHDNFNKIVLDGMMAKAGMVGFDDVLNEEDAYAIHAYILERANVNKELREQSQWWVDLKSWVYSGVAAVASFLLEKL